MLSLFIKVRWNVFNVALLCIVLVFTHCKKDDIGANTPVTPVITKDYLPLTTGSTFTYTDTTDGVASFYTLTASGVKINLFGKDYDKLNGSDGSVRYRTKTGTNYYQIISLPPMHSGEFEDKYLNDSLPVNSTWTESFKIVNVLGFPDSLIAFATYKISEKGVSRTVKGNAYTNVIHVALTDISAYNDSVAANPMIVGIATGNFYYSPGVGLIQSNVAIADNSPYGINAANSSQTLTSYTVK